MNNPASSSRAERATSSWYREPWLWLLLSGPFVVVVASLASAWLAAKSDDGVVAQDYYKQGITINQRLARMAPDTRPLGATIKIAASGELRAHIEGLVEPPKNPRLTLAHPGATTHAVVVMLEAEPGGDFVGALVNQTPGRWIVTLESDSWRLPTTTVAGSLSEIRLGSAERY